MCFEVGRIDHDSLRCHAFSGQRREYPIKRARSAPTHKAVVRGLARTVGDRGVAPHQPAPDDMDDPAEHPAIIDPRHIPRLVGQKRLQAQKLSFCEPEVVIRRGKPPYVWEFESQPAVNAGSPYGS